MSSSTEQAPILLVATAARALAQSARQGGVDVVALDRFADRDTREAALAVRAIPACDGDFEAEALCAAAEALCPPGRCAGLVYGSGLESRPALLERLAAGRTLYGNAPATVAHAKDPGRFFGLLRTLGIPHPETRLTRPAHSAGWLVKQAGASGGGHVRALALTDRRVDASVCYYQKRLSGRSVSLLFLADGVHARTIGFSESWTTAWDETAPWRYAGGASSAEIDAPAAARLRAAAAALTAALGLRGVNGLDAIVQGDACAVLELNPRPGATFELHEARSDRSFFALHLRACAGELPGPLRLSPRAYAHAVVYAPRAFVVQQSVTWPDWCRDLPMPGTAIEQGAPLCTVQAAGATAREAIRRARQREAQVRARFARAAQLEAAEA